MRTHSSGIVRSTLAMVLVSMLVLPGEARSQEQPEAAGPVLVGSRVRLVAPTSVQGQVQGTVMAIDDKSLMLSTDDHRPLKVSRQAITQLEVSTGRRRSVLKGMLIGSAIGIALFAAFPRDELCADLRPGESCSTKTELIGIGALGGAGWGALIGSFVRRDRWSAVPAERVRVSFAPTRGRGARIALSVAF